MDIIAVISSCNLSEARFLLDHFISMAINKVPSSPVSVRAVKRRFGVCERVSNPPPPPGSAGSSEGVSGEGDGGQAETDRDQQCHPEPAAVPHAEGES